MFSLVPACRRLSGLVSGYWFIEDFRGEHAGQPIRTSALPGAVLSVNIGRPNAIEGGALVPMVSLLGVQATARSWRSWSDTYLVMAMLTLSGLTRLFPGIGEDSANRLLDVAGIIGDRRARAIADDVAAAWKPRCIASQLDRWLVDRLEAVRSPAELQRFAAACDILRTGGQVIDAASAADVTRRQLHRWSRMHTGIGPKQLSDIARLQSSLFAVQTGQGDPLEGFSDQAHQIRSWQLRLAVTPGCYARKAPSVMAQYFGGVSSQAKEACVFYL